MQIEKEIRPWTADEKTLGKEVRDLIMPDLREVLLRAYKVVDPTMKALPAELYKREQTKFSRIAIGDFSEAYFTGQSELARDVAQQISYPKYLAGYGLYAGGLAAALSHRLEAREDGQEPVTPAHREKLFNQLMTAVFADVAVTMHHFFATEAQTDQRAMDVLGQALRRLSDGDLTHRIGADAPDKIARARQDYNEAMQKLDQVMQDIAGTTAGVQEGSDAIASALQALSKRTEQQASAMEDSGQALNSISETVQDTARGAREAVTTATEANDMVAKSSNGMKQTQQAMQEIAESSSEIAKIVSVIDNIAMQTNLLALNAGVEAARAGEAGRGFAVVATEVRSLAHRSADAARDIRDLIEASAGHVSRGGKLVDETSQILDETRGKMAEIDTLAGTIRSSAEKQEISIKGINKAVLQSGDLTQQNASMSEEVTAEASRLRDQAHVLHGLLSHFRLTGSGLAMESWQAGDSGGRRQA